VACTVKEQHPYEHCKLKWAKGETFCQWFETIEANTC
jgi:hypothetical protein